MLKPWAGVLPRVAAHVLAARAPRSCAQLRDAIGRWTLAFALSAKLHLREGGEAALEAELQARVAEAERAQALQTGRPHLRLCWWLLCVP